MSPDTPALDFADPANPQSLNLYSFVLNNPLIYTDPDGLDCVYTSNLTSSSVSVETVRGDCRSDKDNGVFVDGHVDTSSYKAQVGSDGDVHVGFGYTAEGDGSVGSAGANGTYTMAGTSAGSLDAGQRVDPSTEISSQSMQFIQQVNTDTDHKVGCIAQAYGVGDAGLATHQLAQPYITKPFAAEGVAPATSVLSKLVGGLGRMLFKVPTPMGGPGTGRAFSMASTSNAGRALGRYAPFVGIATTAYAAFQLGRCY